MSGERVYNKLDYQEHHVHVHERFPVDKIPFKPRFTCCHIDLVKKRSGSLVSTSLEYLRVLKEHNDPREIFQANKSFSHKLADSKIVLADGHSEQWLEWRAKKDREKREEKRKQAEVKKAEEEKKEDIKAQAKEKFIEWFEAKMDQKAMESQRRKEERMRKQRKEQEKLAEKERDRYFMQKERMERLGKLKMKPKIHYSTTKVKEKSLPLLLSYSISANVKPKH